MDPFKLLSRSTKFSRAPKETRAGSTPSSGRAVQPQLFASKDGLRRDGLGKRKRGHDSGIEGQGNERNSYFFDDVDQRDSGNEPPRTHVEETDDLSIHPNLNEVESHAATQAHAPVPLEERKRLFNQHKLKATWLNHMYSEKRQEGGKNVGSKVQKNKNALFPSPLESLRDLAPRYALSKRLSNNIADQGYVVPTEVQIGAIPLLLEDPQRYTEGVTYVSANGSGLSQQIDLLAVAPTGSGKTLAFMIPLLHSLLCNRQSRVSASRHTSAIILAPTKELASQITNEGRKLVKGTGLSISQMRKGMKIPEARSEDGAEADDDVEEAHGTVVKADIIVATPGILQGIINESRDPAWQIQYLILDEADVLLDPLFKEQTLDIWNSLMEPTLRVSLWSATMGSNIEELAVETIRHRFGRLKANRELNPTEAPLVRLVVGLKDSVVPNVKHKLTYAATERGKLMGLRQLLHPVSSSTDTGPALRPPFLVFTQTIERAIALHSELLYDIPAEAGGIGRIAVLHSDLSDAKRDGVMTRFRKGDIWVLITTDLLSRGVDFRGVNGVVNYDIPTSSAAYVHRIGRTGRAGRDGGIAVTLYSKEDIPYLKHVVNVVAMAERQQGTESSVDQWLLDALPKLSKNEKQNLKKRGLEFRTARGQKKDPKMARRAKISTKAGFIRRSENNRKGAILGNRRRQDTALQDEAAEDTDFAGFD